MVLYNKRAASGRCFALPSKTLWEIVCWPISFQLEIKHVLRQPFYLMDPLISQPIRVSRRWLIHVITALNELRARLSFH